MLGFIKRTRTFSRWHFSSWRSGIVLNPPASDFTLVIACAIKLTHRFTDSGSQLRDALICLYPIVLRHFPFLLHPNHANKLSLVGSGVAGEKHLEWACSRKIKIIPHRCPLPILEPGPHRRLCRVYLLPLPSSYLNKNRECYATLIVWAVFLVLPDCGDPGKPNNTAVVSQSKNHWAGEYVRYLCNPGYTMIGPAVRRCYPSGNWSGHAPKCEWQERKYKRQICNVDPPVAEFFFNWAILIVNFLL